MLNEFISLVKNFALSKALMSALEMRLFLRLEKPMSRADLRKELGIVDTNLADAFLDLLITGGILREDGLIELTPLARSVILEHKSIRSWAQEMTWTYQALDYLTPALCSGGLPMARFWPYKSEHHGESDAYSTVMDESAVQLSRAIAASHDFGQYDHVIDFGGGYGRVAVTLAQSYPRLMATVADLPEVCEEATRRIPDELQDRVFVAPYDFLRDSAPARNADAALLVRVLHDWDDAHMAEILGNVSSSLRHSGHILVIEPMRESPRPASVSDAVTSLMLACMGGQRRSVTQISEALLNAGYQDITVRDCGLAMYKIVMGRLP
jgi:SAM-dependent methyltransferase